MTKIIGWLCWCNWRRNPFNGL